MDFIKSHWWKILLAVAAVWLFLKLRNYQTGHGITSANAPTWSLWDTVPMGLHNPNGLNNTPRSMVSSAA